ncbi:MAG TPA: peptidoglycan-binding domain-containing protein [Acidimicrobiia bacterium]|jgi:peptidoglycan hydrolase-like protein with peptidoglycan-binding domain
MRKRWMMIAALAAVLVLVAAACGGDDNASVESGSGSTTPTTASNDGGADSSDGNEVIQIQRELVSLNCNPGPLDGKLGPDTVRAIRFFQQTVGLTPDGVVGPQTRTALASAAQAGTPFCPNIPPPPPPTTSATSATTGGGGGGTPPCTDAAIRPAVVASLQPGEQLFQLNEFHCAITWAVTSPTVGPNQQNSYEITQLLRWNGSAWQVVDRGTYCDGGQVPAAIYQQACQTN